MFNLAKERGNLGLYGCARPKRCSFDSDMINDLQAKFDGILISSRVRIMAKKDEKLNHDLEEAQRTINSARAKEIAIILMQG